MNFYIYEEAFCLLKQQTFILKSIIPFMSKKNKLNTKLDKLIGLLSKKQELIDKKEEMLSFLFKYETLYLETGQGLPISKTSEFYVNNRVEKKKYIVNDKDRVFSLEYPKNK